MTDARKRSLDQILDEAQTMPPGEQLRYIREACASDGALDAPSEMQSRQAWFDAPEDEPESATPPSQPQSDPAGELIGPYRVLRSLGQGGMGEVFLAERADDQFRQRVAIKLVRRGLLSRHVQGRLRQERQILASLDHPNIARLYDGGTTSHGAPYIVMEHIDGHPIDIYCDERKLTIEQRLRLFVIVCSAVHRAHQNLIVHRDLKPSNILVTPDGVPKLLDFGIAKMLDDRDMMHTLAVTEADVRVMTPDHASPEQIRGDLISTASDIYVLGVLLYELLSGYKPFALRGKRLAELERAICEDSAPTLSSAIATAARSPESGVAGVASQRSVSIAKLRRELHGDLENIVTMAMRKEPERRYSSAEQLAADVTRYLDGMPVLARPDSWHYRAGKFVKRHTLAVAASALFVVVLIGFTAAIYLQSERIGIERDVAQAERTRAESERGRAQAVTRFLIESFRSVDPFSQSGGANATAREILDYNAKRITSELSSQPATQAAVMDTIGSAYLGLGLPADAQPLIEQGLSVRRALFGQDSTEVAQSLHSLNHVYEKKGDLETAEALARQTLDINRRRTGENSVETAASICRLGVIQQEKGELATAERSFHSCLDTRIARLGKYHEDVAIPLDNLARIAKVRNDNIAAEQYLNQALEIDLRTRGKEHPQYIRHLMRLAWVTYDLGDVQRAEGLYRHSLELYERVLTPKHPETLDAMSAMGVFLMETNRLDEAEPILQRVLDSNRQLRGPRHAYVGNDLENLGRLAYRRGQFKQAESYFNEALSIYQEKLQPGHGLIAATLTMLGRTQLAAGRSKDAQEVLSRAVDSWRIEYGENSTGYALANAALARSWALQGRLPEAEPVLLASYPILNKSTRAPDHESAREVRQWISDLYRDMGRPDAAQKYFESLPASTTAP